MMCAAMISAFCSAPRRQASSTARSLYELPRTGTRIFLTADTPRIALATAACICRRRMQHPPQEARSSTRAKVAAMAMPSGCSVTLGHSRSALRTSAMRYTP